MELQPLAIALVVRVDAEKGVIRNGFILITRLRVSRSFDFHIEPCLQRSLNFFWSGAFIFFLFELWLLLQALATLPFLFFAFVSSSISIISTPVKKKSTAHVVI